MTQHWI